MPRPAFVFCDTDAVIQFLLAKEVRPFRLLRSKYSIQPLIVPDVEIELYSNRRFGALIAPELKKVLATDLLRVLKMRDVESLYGESAAATAAAGAVMGEINKFGREYKKYVDLGEAYTHAAAVTIGVPALSHDRSALDVLTSAKLKVPNPVLRAFDLIALCYQAHEMSEHDCDAFRSTLIGHGEGVPRCFAHNSFAKGIIEFSPRIVDSAVPPVGRNADPSLPYSAVILL